MAKRKNWSAEQTVVKLRQLEEALDQARIVDSRVLLNCDPVARSIVFPGVHDRLRLG